MTIDHPLVRASFTCPLCRKHKDRDLVVCWPCHRDEKRANHGAYSKMAETVIAAREWTLTREKIERDEAMRALARRACN